MVQLFTLLSPKQWWEKVTLAFIPFELFMGAVISCQIHVLNLGPSVSLYVVFGDHCSTHIILYFSRVDPYT